MAGPPKLRLPAAASTANSVETLPNAGPPRVRWPLGAATANSVKPQTNSVTGAVWPPHPPGVECWPTHPSLLPQLAEMEQEQQATSSDDSSEKEFQRRQQRRLAALVKPPPSAATRIMQRRRTARASKEWTIAVRDCKGVVGRTSWWTRRAAARASRSGTSVVRLLKASWWTTKSKKWWTPLKSMKHMQAMKDIDVIIKDLKKERKRVEVALEKIKEKRAKHWNKLGYRFNRHQFHNMEEQRVEEELTAKAIEEEAIALDNRLRISRFETRAEFLGFFPRQCVVE